MKNKSKTILTIFLIFLFVLSSQTSYANTVKTTKEQYTKNNIQSLTADIIIPDDYDTIQKGIDNASYGDMILIKSGVYEEYNIVVDKKIILKGEELNSTIIKGNGARDVLVIYADEVKVTNLTITHGGNMMEANIAMVANNCTISGNIINGSNDMGIALYNSFGNIIENNFIINCTSTAIRLYQENYNNIIVNNTIINNNGYGITIEESDNNIFSNNTIISNHGGILLYDSMENTISKNKISGGLSGIYLFESEEQNVKNNKISACSKAIYIEESDENIVEKNQMENNTIGLFSSYSYDNIITENNFISNEDHAKFNSLLTDNNFQKNMWYENYWDNSFGILPKAIKGIIFVQTAEFGDFFVPWLNIDWNPARKPYEIQ